MKTKLFFIAIIVMAALQACTVEELDTDSFQTEKLVKKIEISEISYSKKAKDTIYSTEEDGGDNQPPKD